METNTAIILVYLPCIETSIQYRLLCTTRKYYNKYQIYLQSFFIQKTLTVSIYSFWVSDVKIGNCNKMKLFYFNYWNQYIIGSVIYTALSRVCYVMSKRNPIIERNNQCFYIRYIYATDAIIRFETVTEISAFAETIYFLCGHPTISLHYSGSDLFGRGEQIIPIT